ncbi:S26 family signal peptidase [Phycicoccus endophyticus]|uniref:S26 family signal peptidase n=1 Tax=Phycicoccus endophyticus TaxID=1690220 RepID=A0A7G9QY80_9MICO|nr:S26 family signal peptidase [Phycicoccus endophyticus]NHI19194.1 S26 family signal peptidase [Phycicoccus endophyticus]QNN48305.1 S26 family signal peptidase [Phycicoccus endophyticus]GGL40893.1 hypothetical protein GCM10012283_24290 [Phycicoccus endophyticus]
MSARPATDPVPAPRAGTGSRRPGALLVLATALVAAGLVRGLLLESYHVPSAASVPTLEPGDRVLVLKTDRHPATDALVLDDDGGTLRVRRAGEPAASGAEPVGTLQWRYWPLDRLGALTAAGRS